MTCVKVCEGVKVWLPDVVREGRDKERVHAAWV